MLRSAVVALSLAASSVGLAVPQEDRQVLSARQAGPSTSGVARPKVGNVPYGPTLTTCSNPRNIALTFDDGPSSYTSDLLDLLDRESVKATFFITGKNLFPQGIDDCGSAAPGLIKRAYNSGHQIAHHTWTHPYLTSLSEADFNAQMWNNEAALRNILGKFPTYMRPPYLSCDGLCESRLSNLGYHVISTNLDTQDWQYDDASLIQNSKNIFSGAISAGINGPIVLAHDIHYQTVYSLTQHMISTAKAAGYTLTTVGACLNDPPENWYRETGGEICGAVSGGSTPPPTTPSSGGNGKQTQDGQCGANGLVCGDSPSGPCCSQYNWCGVTPEHCGGGCQSAFGICW